MVPGLVTTIIPAYNCKALLPEAVISVLEQTYRPIEVVIVDDGSTDGTSVIADSLARDHKEVYVIHQRNMGLGAAREAGGTIARGEFIQYLDCDDLLVPLKFSLQVEGLVECSHCCASYGKTLVYSFGESVLDGGVLPGTQERVTTMFPRWLEGRIWHTSTPLWRRSALSDVGAWKNYESWEDWEYECRVAIKGGHLSYVDSVVSHTRILPSHLPSDGSIRTASTSRRREAENLKSFLEDRSSALLDIRRHALEAGVDHSASQWIYFARILFWHARRCLSQKMWLRTTSLLLSMGGIVSAYSFSALVPESLRETGNCFICRSSRKGPG